MKQNVINASIMCYYDDRVFVKIGFFLYFILMSPLLIFAQTSATTELSEFKIKDGEYEYVGLKDATGNIILPAQYVSITWDEEFGYAVAGPFNGVALIDKKKGKVMIPATRYGNIAPFVDGFAVVDVYPKESEIIYTGMIDKTGKEFIIPNKYNSLNNFSDGLARVGIEDQSGDMLYGNIDKTGKLITPIVYRSIDGFAEGLAVVESKSGKRGYINPKGVLVIPAIYTYANPFYHGHARVTTGDGDSGRYFKINKAGKEIKFYSLMAEKVKNNDLTGLQTLLKEFGVKSFVQYTDDKTSNVAAGKVEKATIYKSEEQVGYYSNFYIAQFGNGDLQFWFKTDNDVSESLEIHDAGFSFVAKSGEYKIYSNNSVLIASPDYGSTSAYDCLMFKIPKQ